MSDWPQADEIPDDFVFSPDDMPPPAPARPAGQRAARHPRPEAAPRQRPVPAPLQPGPQWRLLSALSAIGYTVAALSAVAGPLVGHSAFTASIEAGRPSLASLFGYTLAGFALAVVLAFGLQIVAVLLQVERNTRNR